MLLPCSPLFVVSRLWPGCVWGCSNRCHCLYLPRWRPAHCRFLQDWKPVFSLFGSSTAEDSPAPQSSSLTPLQESLSKTKKKKKKVNLNIKSTAYIVLESGIMILASLTSSVVITIMNQLMNTVFSFHKSRRIIGDIMSYEHVNLSNWKLCIPFLQNIKNVKL